VEKPNRDPPTGILKKYELDFGGRDGLSETGREGGGGFVER
jgi:hypothetical protein